MGPAGDGIPALVPVSTLQFDRSEQTAIAIVGVWAYSNGFEFSVTRLIRPDAPGFDEDPVPCAPGGILAERQSYQISLQLADGSTVWTAPSFVEAVTSGKVGTHAITEAAPR